MSTIIALTTIGFILLLPATIVNPEPDPPGHPHQHVTKTMANLKDNKTGEVGNERTSSTWPAATSISTLDGHTSATIGHHHQAIGSIALGQRQPPGDHMALYNTRTPTESITEVKRSAEDFEFQLEPPDPPVSLASSSTRITGPFFESNKTTVHITARAGQTVMFDCAVVLLQGRTVSWLRRKKDSLQLLTVGNTTYYSDSRVGLRFRYPNNWRLGIEIVQKGDEGEYQCQLSTHPPKALIFQLKVIAPAVLILDENGHVVTERHYKVDSSLHLTCKASHVDKLVDNIIWLKGDRPMPGGDSRIKVKMTKNQTSGEATAFLSVLSVRKGDSGNYTCRASSLASSTIAVHVLNGELPAAVQHESSGNVLQLQGPNVYLLGHRISVVVVVLPVLISSLVSTLHMPTFLGLSSQTFSS